MPDVTVPYPLTPTSVDPQILQPSSQFRKEAVRALAVVILFVITYALLVAAAFVRALLCAVGGISEQAAIVDPTMKELAIPFKIQ